MFPTGECTVEENSNCLFCALDINNRPVTWILYNCEGLVTMTVHNVG
jgi:hypothetical protein